MVRPASDRTYENSGEVTPQFSVLDGLKHAQELPEDVQVYPRYEFDITEEQMVGKGVIEVPDIGRTRVVLNTLSEQCGGDFKEFAALEAREKILKRANTFLAQKATTRQGVSKKKYLVDKKRAMGEVLDNLADVNHPVVQILAYVQAEFGDQLEPGQLDLLTENILTITNWPKLRAAYTGQINQLRTAGMPRSKS